MKAIVAIVCLGLTASAAGDAVRVSAGAQLRVTGTNATAAYSIDTDCADVEVQSGIVIITGKRPCTTHIVTVAGNKAVDQEVFVSPRQEQLDRLRAARMLQRGISETGYISTLYSSNPGEVSTTMNLSRTEGGHTASMSFSVANGHAFSLDRRRTAVPLASLRFAGPSGAVTLFDSFVDRSPLTISGIDLRGVHVQHGPWFLHAGVASLTNFRERLFDPAPDATVDAGYRFNLTRHSGIIASTQWIRASSLYASGRSGVIGSLMYDYQSPERLRVQLEAGVSGKLAGAALFDYFGSKDHLQLRVRSAPPSFPGLSEAPARGFQGNGAWTRQLTSSLGLDLSASRDTYVLLDGAKQANISASSRLQWRINRFTVSGGFDHAELSRPNIAPIITNSVPVGLGFDSRHFGNSIQYQFRRNRANDLGSYLLRDSIRVNSGPVMLTFYAARQTQAPTIDYVVTNVPGLRQALLAAGITATTPEEILEFIRTHADLIAGGVISQLSLNLAPVRAEYGGTFKWTVRRNLLSMDFGYRRVKDQRIMGHVASELGSANASLRLTPTTTLDVTGSLIKTQAPGISLRSPLLAVGLRQQIGTVPNFFNRFQQHGWIRGVISIDEDGHAAGMADMTVVLDGIRRTRTNQSGFYYFHSVPQGKHTVEVQYQSSGSYVFTSPPSVETDENTVVDFNISARKALLFGFVRNDAGMPLGKAMIRIEGIQQEQMQTSENGSFRFNLKNGGVYTATIDAQSLPPGYDLGALTSQTAHVEVNEPARVDFAVRALRSIFGTVRCTGTPLGSRKVSLLLDHRQSPIAIDQKGNYKISDLASGWHELTITYGGFHSTRRIELPGEPISLGGIDLEVCAADSRAKMERVH